MADFREISHAPVLILLALILAAGGIGYTITQNNQKNSALQNTYVRYISNGSVVGPPRQILDASPPNVGDPIKSVSVSGNNVTVTFDYPSATAGDYIEIYNGSSATNVLPQNRKYLNNGISPPTTAVTTGNVTLSVPDPNATTSDNAPMAFPTLVIPTDRDLTLKQGTFEFQPPVPPTKEAGICNAANVQFDEEGATAGKGNIFIAVDPPNGQPVGPHRQLRAWVRDEAGGMFPNSAAVDANGNVTQHSNPAVDKDSHGYPWETAIYLTKLTPENVNGPFTGDKENGGAPIFQHQVKGQVRSKGQPFLSIPAPDDPTPFIIGTRGGHGIHNGEYVWNVDQLGLTPGNYRVQISLHDGDNDLAIECTTIIL